MEEEKQSGVFDPTAINQLLFSIGRLKFSFRSLEATHFESATLLPPEDMESAPNVRSPSQESNRILENLISGLLSNSSGEERTASSKKSTETHLDSPLEKLEIIRDKLQDELHKMRSHHQSVLSEKLQKHKSVTSQCS